MLERYLGKHGFQVTVESDGARGLERALAENPDAVILDNNLPTMDGFEVCIALRPNYRGVIMMLSSRDEDRDRIAGLELGADDYLTKPMDLGLVRAHLKALLRRTEISMPAEQPSDNRHYGRFSISRATRVVRLGEETIHLTDTEFDLLWLLAENAGTILSRSELFRNLRGFAHDGLDRSIDMTVSRLRRHLGDDAANPSRIKTVRGKGYLFSPTDWD
jgi:two-component system OmpR family response regulator/two-component system response regulator RstA